MVPGVMMGGNMEERGLAVTICEDLSANTTWAPSTISPLAHAGFTHEI